MTNKTVFIFLLCLFSFIATASAFEEVITIPAENPQGVTLDLKEGKYIAKIEGGAMALFFPINPNYRWLVGVAAGTDVAGGQDYPNIGTIYFDPDPPVYSQAEAERQAISAVQDNLSSTYLYFTLKENKKVRFWVSDFDYTDNSGMVKIRIQSVSK